MKQNSRWLSAGVLMPLLLLPAAAMAHTGVGETTGFFHGMAHPLGGMDHMLAMVAVGLWASQLGGRAVWLVPATFVTLMVVGGAIGFSGVAVPFVEQGILLSVLVLGVMIAGALSLPLAASVAVVAFFAIFHGYAHGAEMPVAFGAASYSLGFALVTAALHLIGIASGIGLQRLKVGGVSRVAGGAIALGGVYLAMV